MHTRILVGAVAPLLALALAAPTARAQGLGITGGGNFAELSDIDTGDRQATFDNVSGWHIGLWLDVPLGPVALRPGIRYMGAGELFEDARVDDVPGAFQEASVDLLEIPIDVRFRFGLPLIAPYVMAGPVLRFPAGDDDEERFRAFSLAGGAGVGLEVGLGGLRLYPELKYTFGITRFTEESYELGGVTISPDEDQRLNAVMLSIGIGL